MFRRAAALLAVVAAFIGATALSLWVVAPPAQADTLPNGLAVSCTQDSDIHATCVVSGCPRVDGDYVVDAVHAKINGGEQRENDFKCINGHPRLVGLPRLHNEPTAEYRDGEGEQQ